jgi:hypothetical protein
MLIFFFFMYEYVIQHCFTVSAFLTEEKLVTLVVRTFFPLVLLVSARRMMKCTEDKTQS